MKHLFSLPMLMSLMVLTTASETANDENSDEKQNLIGHAFYLAKTDALHPTSSKAIKFFHDIPQNCKNKQQQRRKYKEEDYFENTEIIYVKLGAEVNLSSTIVGKSSLETTFTVKSKSSFKKTTRVSGLSYKIGGQEFIESLKRECLSDLQLREDVMEDFERLPIKLDNLFNLIREYQYFFEKHGSHILTEVSHGALLRRFVFVEQTTVELHKDDLQAFACLRFRVFTMCAGVDYQKSAKMKSYNKSDYIDILSGSNKTLESEITKEVEESLLNDSQENPVPISFKFTSTWDVLNFWFANDNDNKNRADILEQVYMGYFELGCYNRSDSGFLLRSFRVDSINDERVLFECVLEREGCHSDDDCHGTGPDDIQCYGNTAVEHYTSSPSKVINEARVRRTGSGGPDDGINKSCFFKDNKPQCNPDYSSERVIWDGESGIRKHPVTGATKGTVCSLPVLAVVMSAHWFF